MSWSLVAYLSVGVFISIIVLFALVGRLGLGDSTLAQILTAAVACGIGVFLGQAAHRKFI